MIIIPQPEDVSWCWIRVVYGGLPGEKAVSSIVLNEGC